MGVYSGYSQLNESYSYYGSTSRGGHIMDTVIESVTNDLNMFNAVITLDFAEAYTELGYDVFSEADLPMNNVPQIEDKSGGSTSDDAKSAGKKGIIAKIKEFFSKLGKKISEFVNTFISKLQNMTANDAKTYKKYADQFSKNCGTAKVTIPKINKLEDIQKELEGIANEAVKLAETATNSINSASSTEDINKAVETLNESIKKFDIGRVTDTYLNGKESDSRTLGSDEISSIKNVMQNSKSMIQACKNAEKSGQMSIKQAQSALKIQIHDAKSTDADSTEIAKLNALYKVATVSGNLISKLSSAEINAISRYIAQCRKAFLIVARGKSEEEKAKNESAMIDYILGEASDMYVQKALSTF